MHTRRWLKPSGVLGALALSIGLSTPAWAMWEGLDPIQPIMPSWTWQGIENQERLRDLTPEQVNRIRRLPSEQQEQALQELSRERRGTMRGGEGMRERMRRLPIDEMQERTRTPDEERGGEEMRRPGETERETDDGSMRQEETGSPDGEMRQQETGSPDEEMRREDGRTSEPRRDDETRQQPDDQPEMRQDQQHEHERTMQRETPPTQSGVRQGADGGMHRTEVELKPVPKSTRAPAPGESTVVSDNPIDEAGTHLGMARTSALAKDWEATKSHLRQAEESLDQVVAKGDRHVQRYLDRLKGEIRNTEKAVDARARDLDIRLENLERNVRNLRPEER